MKAVIQRVKEASVQVHGKVFSKIGNGLLTLLGIAKGDSEEQLKRIIEKIIHLRIFEDPQGKMNLSLKDKGFEHLIISQFTLLADCSKGKRPSFLSAESSLRAIDLYKKGIQYSKEEGIRTEEGVFGADMKINLVNDGPATFIIEI